MFGMRRREFITLLGGAAAAWPLAARATPQARKLYRIGLLSPGSGCSYYATGAFTEGLASWAGLKGKTSSLSVDTPNGSTE